MRPLKLIPNASTQSDNHPKNDTTEPVKCRRERVMAGLGVEIRNVEMDFGDGRLHAKGTCMN
jgi:hypothetical protein